MVAVAVRDQNGVQHPGIDPDLPQPAAQLAVAEPDVEQNAGTRAGHERRIPCAAAPQHRQLDRDGSLPPLAGQPRSSLSGDNDVLETGPTAVAASAPLRNRSAATRCTSSAVTRSIPARVSTAGPAGRSTSRTARGATCGCWCSRAPARNCPSDDPSRAAAPRPAPPCAAAPATPRRPDPPPRRPPRRRTRHTRSPRRHPGTKSGCC